MRDQALPLPFVGPVVGQQGAQLERVQLEASAANGGDVVAAVLGRLQQIRCLGDSGKMAIGSELQALSDRAKAQ